MNKQKRSLAEKLPLKVSFLFSRFWARYFLAAVFMIHVLTGNFWISHENLTNLLTILRKNNFAFAFVTVLKRSLWEVIGKEINFKRRDFSEIVERFLVTRWFLKALKYFLCDLKTFLTVRKSEVHFLWIQIHPDFNTKYLNHPSTDERLSKHIHLKYLANVNLLTHQNDPLI